MFIMGDLNKTTKNNGHIWNLKDISSYHSEAAKLNISLGIFPKTYEYIIFTKVDYCCIDN